MRARHVNYAGPAGAGALRTARTRRDRPRLGVRDLALPDPRARTRRPTSGRPDVSPRRRGVARPRQAQAASPSGTRPRDRSQPNLTDAASILLARTPAVDRLRGGLTLPFSRHCMSDRHPQRRCRSRAGANGRTKRRGPSLPDQAGAIRVDAAGSGATAERPGVGSAEASCPGNGETGVARSSGRSRGGFRGFRLAGICMRAGRCGTQVGRSVPRNLGWRPGRCGVMLSVVIGQERNRCTHAHQLGPDQRMRWKTG